MPKKGAGAKKRKAVTPTLNLKRAAGKKGKIIVAVSGGFDPIHIGHVRMFHEAKKLGDELVVIINNDNWLRAKKQHIFMPDTERAEVIAAFRDVDHVMLTGHRPHPKDKSVCAELEELKPDIFANGGDRKPDGDPVPEVAVCERLGIEMVYNVGAGGKIQSSSWLLKNYVDAVRHLFVPAPEKGKKKRKK